MANWNNLPQDIITVIANQLLHIDDFVRFSAVSKPIQSATLDINKRPFTPLLMLSENESKPGFRRFFNLSSEKVFTIYLPEIQGRRCLGTPSGWIFAFGIDLNISLLNPLSGVQITLPPQPTFKDQYKPNHTPEYLRWVFIQKVCLASKTNSDLVAMVIYSQRSKLAFASPRDKSWTTLKLPGRGVHTDVIFFNGQFYAVTCNGMVRICDINKPVPEAIEFALPPGDVRPESETDMYYLIEMGGDLHLVIRILDAVEFEERDEDEGEHEDEPKEEDGYLFRDKTINFEVHKLDIHTKEWTELYDLGDYALFVGNNASFAISTTDYPEFKGDRIYYTDDNILSYSHGGRDMGIFNFKKEIWESFYSGEDTLSKFSPPLFVKPSLC